MSVFKIVLFLDTFFLYFYCNLNLTLSSASEYLIILTLYISIIIYYIIVKKSCPLAVTGFPLVFHCWLYISAFNCHDDVNLLRPMEISWLLYSGQHWSTCFKRDCCFCLHSTFLVHILGTDPEDILYGGMYK